jgi:hypothetical protein
VSHRCLAAADLAGALALGPDDPLRVEIERCPRCRALLLSYEEFLHDRSLPPGLDPRQAAARLREAFERELAGDTGGARAAAGAPRPRPAAGPSPPPSRSRLAAWLGGPRARLAWSAAAAVILAGGIYAGARWWTGARDADALRAERDSIAHPGDGRPVLLEPRAIDGGLVLAWTRTPGAEAYRVLLLGPDLVEFARLGPFADTVGVLEWRRLPRGLPRGSTVAFQVEALQAGVPILSSDLGTLQVR